LVRRLDGSQSWSAYVKKRKISFLFQDSNPDSLVVQLKAQSLY
jgi:hypothetical protein